MAPGRGGIAAQGAGRALGQDRLRDGGDGHESGAPFALSTTRAPVTTAHPGADVGSLGGIGERLQHAANDRRGRRGAEPRLLEHAPSRANWGPRAGAMPTNKTEVSVLP